MQIAALSPADINYDETLSTLRFGKSNGHARPGAILTHVIALRAILTDTIGPYRHIALGPYGCPGPYERTCIINWSYIADVRNN